MKLQHGLKDGVAIALGYAAVAFTFGVSAVAKGFPIWAPILTSLTNFTGTGQFVGFDLIYAGATIAELLITMFIINIRYALMSVTLGQRLSPNIGTGKRMLIAFGMTDENFAVAMSRAREITFSYMMGVICVSFTGWATGTVVGAIAGDVLPAGVLTAFGIALYAMFIAIIIPPCKTSYATFAVVLIAVAMSCCFRYIPVLNRLSSGWVIIICGIAAAVVGALLFPIKPAVDRETVRAERIEVSAAEEHGETQEPDAEDKS